MKNIRKAINSDLSRITEIVVFNYRLNFYPIFQNDEFYFNELQVCKLTEKYKNAAGNVWVYDDGAIKGFIEVENREVKKLFVEPVLQGRGIGAELLDFAISELDVKFLWALKKNNRAINFYERHGFSLTTDRKPEEGTTEYLVRLER